MSYTPTNWQTGDTVTAEKLNKMESGIANSGYWIKLVPDMNLMTFVVPQDIAEEVRAKMSDINVNINGFILYDTNDTLVTVVGGVKTATTVDPSVIGYIQSGSALSNDFLSGFSGEIILEASSYDLITKLIPDTFIVNLTPTAQDFSGTMDKTVGEIRNAQENGRKILFHMITGANDYIEVAASEKKGSDWPFPSYCAFVLTDTPINALISVITPPSNDGSDTIYYTAIYPLTPMS